MDIRKWLSPGGSKTNKPVKRKAAIISDDEDEAFEAASKKRKPAAKDQAPAAKCKKEVSRKKINYIDSSDSESEKASQPPAKKASTSSTSHYFDSASSIRKPSLSSSKKEMSATDFFGGLKGSQSPSTKPGKKTSTAKSIPETPRKTAEIVDVEDPLDQSDLSVAVATTVSAASPARRTVQETPEPAASSPRRSGRHTQSPLRLGSPHVTVSSPRKTTDLRQNPKRSPARASSVASPTRAFSTVDKRPQHASSPLTLSRKKLDMEPSGPAGVSPVRKSDSQSAGRGRSLSPAAAVKAASKPSITTTPSKSKESTTPAKPAASLTPSSTSAKGGKEPAGEEDISPAPMKRNRSYFEFRNREGPRCIGSRQLPEGADNCLAGLTFIVTGILESVEREDAQELVTRHGGKLTQTVGKRASYMVVGREPGPAKIEKAEKFGVKQLTEGEFFDLIETLPAKSYDAGAGSSKKKPATGNKKPIVLGASPEEEKAAAPAPRKKAVTADEIPLVTVKKAPEAIAAAKAKAAKSSASSTSPAFSSKAKTAPAPAAAAATSSASTTGSLAARMGGAGKPAEPEQEQAPSLLWVDKYRPRTLKQLIGQQGDRSNMNKLMKWLRNWHRNLANYNGRPDRDSGAGYRAALLSGPPGIGKTTTATLVCQEAGFHFVELNASDTRSKNLLQTVVAASLDNQTIDGMLSAGSRKDSQEHNALLMDEVDGMAGNEDRGGMQELVQLIKNTKMPIICMCNDRNSQKIRSLANYCFDLRFQRPRVEQIRGAMLSVACREGISIKPPVLDLIINAANNDIRQVLHHMYLWTIRDHTMSYDQAKEDTAKAEKHMKLSPFEVIRKVFSHETGRRSLNDQLDLFFQDYSLMPLFVQEMYPKARPSAATSPLETLDCLSKAAESISQADLVERRVRSANAWGLLPLQGMLSVVVPGMIMRGSLGAQVEFPSWLGKRSRQTKCDRLLQELCLHSRMMTSASKVDMGLDMVPHLQRSVLQPLLSQGSAGAMDSVERMTAYGLLREDLDSLAELAVYPPNEDPFGKLESKTKAAFTRLYNKNAPNTTYSVTGLVKKRKARGPPGSGDDVEGEDGTDGAAESEEETEVDVAALLQKKKKAKPAAGAASKPAQRGAGAGRGRGRAARK